MAGEQPRNELVSGKRVASYDSSTPSSMVSNRGDDRLSIDPWTKDIARLENDVRDLRSVIDRIDITGTRGILPLTVQVTELAKDVAKIEVTLDRLVPGGVNWRNIALYVAISAPMYGLLAQQLITNSH